MRSRNVRAVLRGHSWILRRALPMNLDLYKAFYEQEWQRQEHLQSAVNTPISIVTLLAGGLVLMGKGFESQDTTLVWPFWIATAVASMLVSGSVYLLIRSIHG